MPQETSEFDAIRPYHDEEVPAVLDQLLREREFIDVISKIGTPRSLRFMGKLLTPASHIITRQRLRKRFDQIKTVRAFQLAIEPYLQSQLQKSAEHLSVSGLDSLDRDRAYLFISNHRDIAMDPAIVNWQLHQHGHDTLRIAIGDNLLSKRYVSDLMRLNKSFIVQRSASSPREKLKAAKLLSRYIHHSITQDNENVWIAQREGRAKNGYDLTNQAVLSMLTLAKPKKQGLGEYLREVRIVPVAISYEFDPCDFAKAVEVSTKETQGEYEKQEHEDVASIAAGIDGEKGDIHVHFAQPLASEYESIEEVTAEIDRKIHQGYVLHLTNVLAWQQLNAGQSDKLAGLGVTEKQIDIESEEGKLLLAETKPVFEQRMMAAPEPFRTKMLQAYAKPIDVKLKL